MTKITWQSIKLTIKELQAYPNNPRTITDKAYRKLVESLKQDGYHQRIICDVNNQVIGGHQRIKAMLDVGYKPTSKIEVLKASRELTEEEFQRINIRDNLQHGDWDMDTLANAFDVDLLIDWGFDESLLGVGKSEVEGLTDADDVPKTPDVPVTVAGDIWELGGHYIYCGDSTGPGILKQYIDSHKVDLLFTDPPYQIETKGGCKGSIGKSLRKQGAAIEHIADFDPLPFLKAASSVFTKNNFNAYVFCNKDLLPDYLHWAKQNNISFNVLVWKKPNAIPIGGSHYSDIEYVLLFRKNATWNGGLRTVSYSRCLIHDRDLSENHPTVKPVELITNQLLISTNEGDTVLDMYLGSGSTLIACEKIKRVCYGMEIEPVYVDVAVKRWQEFTGKSATLFGTKKTFSSVESQRFKKAG